MHFATLKLAFTTIRIELETREKLQELGKKGETYNEIIKRLVEMAQAQRKSTDSQYFLRSGRPSDLG